MTKNPLAVPCRYCGAKQNQPCTNKITHQPLTQNLPHTCRTTDATTIIPLPNFIPATDYNEEDLF